MRHTAILIFFTLALSAGAEAHQQNFLSGAQALPRVTPHVTSGRQSNRWPKLVRVAVPQDQTTVRPGRQSEQSTNPERDSRTRWIFPKLQDFMAYFNRRTIPVQATAYGPEAKQTDSTPWHGAYGDYMRYGYIASNELARGTVVSFREFPGRFFTVMDIMGPRWSVFSLHNRQNVGKPCVDFFMPNVDDSYKFKRRDLHMTIHTPLDQAFRQKVWIQLDGPQSVALR